MYIKVVSAVDSVQTWLSPAEAWIAAILRHMVFEQEKQSGVHLKGAH